MDDYDSTAADPPTSRHAIRRPRWVNVVIVVAVALVLMVVVMLLVGGHGPARHAA